MYVNALLSSLCFGMKFGVVLQICIVTRRYTYKTLAPSFRMMACTRFVHPRDAWLKVARPRVFDKGVGWAGGMASKKSAGGVSPQKITT